jgi:energy-coupling factor transporter transmembrane protein EcfT
LHPTCALIVWLAAVLALQAFGYAGVLLLAGSLMISAGGIPRQWWGYVRRARWLLLTLWLILAYNVPGEAVLEVSWAPTYEGVADANLHALRLVVMLGCLAWLFDGLGRDGLVSALWGLLHPCRSLGLDTERLVVRLALVLDHLKVAPESGGWRRMLHAEGVTDNGPKALHLAVPRWSVRDSLVSSAVTLALLGVLVA